MGAGNSKLEFKQSVFRLYEDHSIAPSDPYWALFWQVPDTADDIFSLFSPIDVRRARDIALPNLEHLIISSVARLVFLLRNSQLHYATASTLPADAAAPASKPRLSAAQATRETLNCMRILARVMPFVFEKTDLEQWQHTLFWGTPISVAAQFAPKGTRPPAGEVAEDDIENDDRPIGAAMIDSLTDLLFLPGFAIPIVSGHDPTVAYTIWETGIGSTTPIGTTHQLESNKIETLRTLLVITSKALYSPANALPTKGVRFTSYMVCNPEKRVVLGLLCSLLNTVMKYNPGWRVPYNHMMFSDPRQILVTYSLQLLMVLLTYTVPNDENLVELGITIITEGTPAEDVPVTAKQMQDLTRKYLRNWYRFYLGRLHRMQDLQFLADGISRLLNQPMQALVSYLPSSQVQVEWAPELVMLFWELTRQNNRFRNYIISSDRVHDFVILFIYYAYNYRLDPSRVGLVRLCVYVLQTISQDAVFCVRLNKHFDSHHALPSFMRVKGWDSSTTCTYADYLLLSLYSLMLTSNDRLSALYGTLLDIQINIAPHLSNVSTLTCGRMMQLFSILSTPGSLVQNETNHFLVDKLLIGINGMIANSNHQSNANLLYTIYRARRKFEMLKDLTYERCMEDVRLQRRAVAAGAGMGDAKHDVVIVFDGASSSSAGASSSSASSSSTVPPSCASQDGIFTPTEHWFNTWHAALHFDLIMHLINVLPSYIPRINTLQPLRSTASNVSPSPTRAADDVADDDIVQALRHIDDDTLLPPSYPREFREPSGFEWTIAAKGWYYSVLWAAIFTMHEVWPSASQSTSPSSPLPSFPANESSGALGTGTSLATATTTTLSTAAAAALSGLTGLAGTAASAASAVTGVGSGTSGVGAGDGGAVGVGAGSGVWRGTRILLFRVQETKVEGPSLLRPRGAVDAVAKSMLERLGATSGGSGSGGPAR
ncbi:high-temperature-induced dauer-formation protein-domain-containing protein [Limtongia smithiae]|uniref:high-temperature-induced dauer-formation protein-domain-containing protein n=1 Tax=Limtongia smithiae TaxID=1125753 RepID=UPI0034CD4E01